ncbi:hypothetical protein BBJ28_00002452 [Nothophytophthora sp. Chile5]|nr:hypothetical protein BBJ28_00002452 [Nothophytophthora sp. Chile5]
MSHYSRSSVGRSSISSSVAGAPTALRNDAILYLTILSARDVKNTQTLGEQDPYCGVYLTTGGREHEKAAFKTGTHDNGGTAGFCGLLLRRTHPIWNEKGTILIPDISADVIRFRIKNDNWGKKWNPSSQPRVQFGEYPQHFIPGKTKLYLGLVSGDKLRDIQSFGTQDPFCEVYLGRSRTPPAKDLVYRSKTHDNGGNTLIGELCLKVEMLIGRNFEDKSYPIEADDTIVGQVRLQLALFNDEILDEEEDRECDVDGCACASKQPVRATKVGDVLINGISPDGVQYMEAGTAVHTGCELAGDYVVEKDVYDGGGWRSDEFEPRQMERVESDEWEGDEL